MHSWTLPPRTKNNRKSAQACVGSAHPHYQNTPRSHTPGATEIATCANVFR